MFLFNWESVLWFPFSKKKKKSQTKKQHNCWTKIFREQGKSASKSLNLDAWS